MEWTIGKQDPQAPLAVEQPKQPELPKLPELPEQSEQIQQPGQLSTPLEWDSEDTLVEIYEEGIQEETELIDDAGYLPEPLYTQWWDDMRGGPQYEALSFSGPNNQ